MDYTARIARYLEDEVDTINRLDLRSISRLINVLAYALEQEKSIYIFGNGGSASTASHLQNDFNKGISEFTDKKFRFCCLNDNIATVMAIANDISYDEVFRFQLQGRLTRDDIVIGISGSGNSKNVIHAVEYARKTGAFVITFTGFDGGVIKPLSDLNVNVGVDSMQITEDVHLLIGHLIMDVFYREICKKRDMN